MIKEFSSIGEMEFICHTYCLDNITNSFIKIKFGFIQLYKIYYVNGTFRIYTGYFGTGDVPTIPYGFIFYNKNGCADKFFYLDKIDNILNDPDVGFIPYKGSLGDDAFYYFFIAKNDFDIEIGSSVSSVFNQKVERYCPDYFPRKFKISLEI